MGKKDEGSRALVTVGLKASGIRPARAWGLGFRGIGLSVLELF